jgi:aminoglycoside 6'-N-acetyltransferase
VRVTFRRLTDDDLPLLHGWLNEPAVVRWWEGEDVSWDAVVADYGSGNDDPVEHFLALVDGEPAGWIQCYALADELAEPETQAFLSLGADPTGAGIDYLVGAPAARGRGLGSSMIRAFVDDVVLPRYSQAVAGPYVANEASWRALEKAGFRHLGDYDTGDPDGPARVLVRDRTIAP